LPGVTLWQYRREAQRLEADAALLTSEIFAACDEFPL
jgi:hypothetical protein